MARKDYTQTEGGPSLFDGLNPQDEPETRQDRAATPQDTDAYDKPATAEEWAATMHYYEDTKRTYEQAGLWAVWPPETLLRRAEVYYNQRVRSVVSTMTAAGAPVDVVNAVCSDYIGILSGSCKFVATVEQIQTALKTLQPSAAFTIDRYGLYFGLFLNYSRFLLVYNDYDFTVKGLHATEDTKRVYLSEFYPPMDARAVRWLLDRGYFQASDFSGFEPSEMGNYFARIGVFAELGEYVLYYTVARLALLATPQELAEVTPPSHATQGQTDLTTFCEQVVKETVEQLDATAEKFGEGLTSDAPTEQAQAQKAARDWHDDTNARPIKIHENYGLVLSRPVNVSPNGPTIIDTLPIQKYIDDYNQHPEQYSNFIVDGTVTEQSVQRVFEGLNLLPQYLSGSMTQGADGRLQFRTNLSEFSEICGYVDAGQAEKMALLGSLLLLRNLYFVVQKPYKYVEYTTMKGRKRRKQVGGPTAMLFVNVPEIGLQRGDLVIEITPESLKGRPTFLTFRTLRQLQANNKSTRQSRFNWQIATKSHKSERDLIDQVFGLEDMIKYAATDAERKRVNTYIRKHRPDFRKKVLAWFGEYVEAGILTEFKREPSKTDKKDFVLSWVCPDTKKLDPPPLDPQAEDVDEQ